MWPWPYLIGGNMSFNAKFYTFSKKINSTMQPSGGTDYPIILKASSSVVSPTIQLDVGQSGKPTAYNYCYISEFNRYYRIKDWRWDNRLWIAELVSDPLASFKSNIGSYQAYVSRAAAAYDGDIMDSYYPAKAEITEIKADAKTYPEFTHDINTGCFVIGVQGDSAAPNGGAVTYYAVRPPAIKAITDYLLDPQNYNITDIEEDLLKCIFNPLQFIVSCLWFPMTEWVMASDDIKIGWWTITGTSGCCKQLTDTIFTRNLVYPVPKHPQAAARGNYLNMQPYSQYIINAGPWGAIPIDNKQLLDETNLVCWMNIDLMTGTGRLSIVGKDNAAYIEDHMAQVGVPVQLGQNMLNQGALFNSIGSGVNSLGAIMHTSPGSLLTNGLSAIYDVASLSQAQPVSVSSNGSMAFNIAFNIIGRFLTIVDEDIISRGRPLCKKMVLSSLSGYIMCEDADPEIPCTDSELEEIVNYLNTGFYYE